MDFDSHTLKKMEIFHPKYKEKVNEVERCNRRFAYYTSADTARKVIQNEELWFRNVTVMNDVSEISYGLELIRNTFSGPIGKRFREAVENIFEGTISQVSERLKYWVDDWKLETYIACISMHEDSEDHIGRLSMWRAYGDIALVINNTPLLVPTDRLGVFSLPVTYSSNEQFETRLSDVASEVLKNKNYLQSLGQDKLVDDIKEMLFHIAIATKHPGFAEEKEWRLFYRPSEQTSPRMEKRVEVIGGVPQIIYALCLGNEPEVDLHGAAIPNLLDRIIVGPTEYPYVSVQAFLHVLEQKGVQDFQRKVVFSDIPLRKG